MTTGNGRDESERRMTPRTRPANPRSAIVPAVVDPICARQTLRVPRGIREREPRTIGSPDFRAAMGEVRRLGAELGGVGVDPASSSKESTKRKLCVPVAASRPGQHERHAERDA